MTDEGPLDKDEVLTRLRQLRQAVVRRAVDCGRDPASVRVTAVSKTFSADEVWPTIAEGDQRRFGENRVQEAQAKWRDLRGRAAGLGRMIELHLIGPLQTNKAREAVETFDVIETVDREKIAAVLAESMAKSGKRPRLFVQVNTGAEPQKAGVGAARSRRLYRVVPREIRAGNRRADVHPASRGAGIAAFRAPRGDRQTLRNRRTVDGHERRLAAGDSAWRDLFENRQRNLRGALVNSIGSVDNHHGVG